MYSQIQLKSLGGYYQKIWCLFSINWNIHPIKPQSSSLLHVLDPPFSINYGGPPIKNWKSTPFQPLKVHFLYNFKLVLGWNPPKLWHSETISNPYKTSIRLLGSRDPLLDPLFLGGPPPSAGPPLGFYIESRLAETHKFGAKRKTRFSPMVWTWKKPVLSQNRPISLGKIQKSVQKVRKKSSFV